MHNFKCIMVGDALSHTLAKIHLLCCLCTSPMNISMAFMFFFWHLSRLHGSTRAGMAMLCPCLHAVVMYAGLKFECTQLLLVPFVVPL